VEIPGRRVEWIRYHFVTIGPPAHDFSQAEAWSGVIGDFDCTLADELLTAAPRREISSEADARAELEPHLRRWETYSEIHDKLWIELRYDAAGISEEGSDTNTHYVRGVVEATADAHIVRHHPAFPHPPLVEVADSPIVRRFRQRLRDIRNHREPLLAGAYWILTQLEESFGGGNRAATGRALGVSAKVLERLGALSAIDDPVEGRKAGGEARPLTQKEHEWLQDALSLLVLRLAEVEAGIGSLPQITLADLPTL
jgi:hypothetical protein